MFDTRYALDKRTLWPKAGKLILYRTDELFDIIVDYPESLAALEDLKVNYGLSQSSRLFELTRQECLAKIDQRDTLVNKLKASYVQSPPSHLIFLSYDS